MTTQPAEKTVLVLARACDPNAAGIAIELEATGVRVRYPAPQITKNRYYPTRLSRPNHLQYCAAAQAELCRLSASERAASDLREIACQATHVVLCADAGPDNHAIAAMAFEHDADLIVYYRTGKPAKVHLWASLAHLVTADFHAIIDHIKDAPEPTA